MGSSIFPEALDMRRTYYKGSYRFVRYLIDTAGMDMFLRLYDHEDTETALTRFYGASREELVLRAMAK